MYVIFDENYERVPTVIREQVYYGRDGNWQSELMAVRERRGWRLFPVKGVYYHLNHVGQLRVYDWVPPARPEHKRFPTVAALEMYVRHTRPGR